MTDDEVHDAIIADSEVKVLADAGRDAEAASLFSLRAPKEIFRCEVNEQGIFALFDNPVEAEQLLQTLDGLANQDPVIKRMLGWLKPPASGLPLGSPVVRERINQIHTLGLFTDHIRDILLQAAERPIVIDHSQISRIWNTRYRGE